MGKVEIQDSDPPRLLCTTSRCIDIILKRAKLFLYKIKRSRVNDSINDFARCIGLLGELLRRVCVGRKAVDNLIKITAGENGCRYSHALTACNMLPASMGATHFYFIPRSKRARSKQLRCQFLFPNSVPVSLLDIRVEGVKKKKKNTFHEKKVRTKLQQVFEREKRIELKIDEILTLSPRCIPTFAAGPSGRVHITYANVRPSVPVLPPTTLRPKPAAVKLNNLSIYNTRWKS